MVLIPVQLIGGHQDALGRDNGVGEPQGRAAAIRKQAAACAEHEGVDHQQLLIDQVGGHQRSDQFPLPMITKLPLDACLSSATLAGTSPSKSVEFGHSSLVARLCEATYL